MRRKERRDVFHSRVQKESRRNSPSQQCQRGQKDTAMPRVKTHQLIIPLMARLRSTWNSSMIEGIPMEIPPRTQPATKAKRQTVLKATIFFHFGQLRGSLTSLEGAGTRITSAAVLLYVSWATKGENQLEPKTDNREGGDTVDKRNSPLTSIKFPQRMEFKSQNLCKTRKDNC